ncbi:PhnA domain-containing protein [Mangrovibacterium diazotrophicum]|uniref:Phosphonoacetate hydrolase n=1 Tax=Mangrovibacterium diazotrophicum TaxID=1261403 RepID=A0A419WBG3_9BACT|nr:alkylphosphonate utilization protein [Mangrovibacterium diazotrophicum]RKD92805.1 phosphonoacetate hydrolase [Mangrovibacterium diazotrophicum]
MSIEKALNERSGSVCELCGNTEGLTVYALPPVTENNSDKCVLLCSTCNSQVEEPETMDADHWRCLNDSMWSTVPAVQVLAWRLLNQLKQFDLVDMLYLDEETLAWAKSGLAEDEAKHVDSNGVRLAGGDSVVLIKDLVVKGAGFTAKRGTPVRNISLVKDNVEHIEGKVNGQQIVILTQYVKKTN